MAEFQQMGDQAGEHARQAAPYYGRNWGDLPPEQVLPMQTISALLAIELRLQQLVYLAERALERTYDFQ